MNKNCYEILKYNIFSFSEKEKNKCIKDINKQLKECRNHQDNDKLVNKYKSTYGIDALFDFEYKDCKLINCDLFTFYGKSNIKCANEIKNN